MGIPAVEQVSTVRPNTGRWIVGFSELGKDVPIVHASRDQDATVRK
jgi:hypothetical protein